MRNCPNISTLSLYGYEVSITHSVYRTVQDCVLRTFLTSSCTLSVVTTQRMTRRVWRRRRPVLVCHCWNTLLYLTGKVFSIYPFLFIGIFHERSYLTEHGVRALLQYLPKLQTLNFPGGWRWLWCCAVSYKTVRE